MTTIKYFSFLLSFCFIFGACQFDYRNEKEEEVIEEEEEAEDDIIRIEINGDELEIATQELEEKINASVNQIISEIPSSFEGDWEEGEEVEMMDHRALKSLLPNRLGSMEQTDYASEKSGAFGFRVATAEARYEYKDQWIEIELVDLGEMPIARIGLEFWDEIEVDRESKEEYEKTYIEGDNKFHEQYNKKYKKGELNTVYRNRYVLSVEGKNVSLSELEKARDKVKTHKLE